MSRIGTALLTLSLLVLGACSTVAPPTETVADFDFEPRIETVETADAVEATPSTDAEPMMAMVAFQKTEAGALDYAMVVPENVAYVPWKMISGLGNGMYDGVAAGFERGNMPILSLLFSPVNAVVGGVTGFFNGTFASPMFKGAYDEFGKVMGDASSRDTPIWWLSH